jgi:hypothetical protein
MGTQLPGLGNGSGSNTDSPFGQSNSGGSNGPGMPPAPSPAGTPPAPSSNGSNGSNGSNDSNSGQSNATGGGVNPGGSGPASLPSCDEQDSLAPKNKPGQRIQVLGGGLNAGQGSSVICK